MKNAFSLELLIFQIIAVIILFIIILEIQKVIRANKLEKRIGKYGIDSLDNTTFSLFDLIEKKIRNIIKTISSILNKSHFLKKISKKYNKYVNVIDTYNLKPIDFISLKIIFIVGFILILIISNIIRNELLTITQFLVAFLIGYFLLDIILILNKLFRKKQIEDDMLKAIMIMNNAFKSGRTTMQAIEVVKDELTGSVGEEFKKMYLDISYGLSLDVAFDRFARRINTEDARYISASLSILNKTGGDIVRVFSTIEKSVFNRRKLRIELKTLTASANVMFKFLTATPFIIFFVIFLLNPEYFIPLVSTTYGLIISGLIIVIFITYILLVKKVMKIKV